MTEPASAGPVDYAARGRQLAATLDDLELDLLLITDLVNVRWLTGFTGTNGACLSGPDLRLFLTDFRYAERAAKIDGWDGEIVTDGWLEGIAARLSGRVGFEAGHLTVSGFEQLAGAVGEGTTMVPAGGEVERLRRVKQPFELDAMAEAARLTDLIYLELIERGLAGRSEAEVARFAVARMREEGAEPAFPPIVAAGPDGASPHAEPSSREIGRGELVTVDMGSQLDGYCSDCTRTFASGSEADLDGFARTLYEITLEAQLRGLDEVAAGFEAVAVDEAARSVIEAAGFGGNFGHGLGHGVGLEIHEAPRLGPRSRDVLLAGDVVTIEPGIYVPGRTGVRIEDMVAVGNDGVERNFSTLSKELIFVP